MAVGGRERPAGRVAGGGGVRRRVLARGTAPATGGDVRRARPLLRGGHLLGPHGAQVGFDEGGRTLDERRLLEQRPGERELAAGGKGGDGDHRWSTQRLVQRRGGGGTLAHAAAAGAADRVVEGLAARLAAALVLSHIPTRPKQVRTLQHKVSQIVRCSAGVAP